MRLMYLLVAAMIATTPVYAQEVAITPSDTMQSILAAQKGKRVTVRLGSGQELTGTIREASATLVVIGAITGREFFDAVVPLTEIEAVLIRTKQ